MLKKILIFLLSCAFLGAFGVFLIFYKHSKDLPSHHQLSEYDPPIATRLYSANGDLLEEYATEHRIFVPISNVPKSVINAFLAAEDKNFYSHPGIDIYSIFRAMLTNVSNLSKGKSLVGGSTITQQVVKNFLLTNEKSYSRKVKEAILSFRISKSLSKDRILELYLNQIYLGASSYGIASASLNYFNKSIDELTIEEAAILASLPKAPSIYDPRKNYEKALERRNWVIKRMLEDGHISKQEASNALATPINIQTRKQPHVVNSYSFTEEVRRDIARKYGSMALYEGGLVVRTTIDNELQQFARDSMLKGLQEYEKRHGYRGPIAKFKNLDNWQSKVKNLFTQMQINMAKLDPFELAIVSNVTESQAQIWLYKNLTQKNDHINLKDMSWAGKKAQTANQILQVGEVILVKQITANSHELVQMPKVSGGMIVMDPYSGRVLAMVGGFFENLEFNRVTQGRRQPGSAIKPFIYLTALENGFTPASIINDNEVELPQGPGLPMWKPKNHSGDFFGPTPLRKGVEKSRNAMTVNLAVQVGMDKITKLIKDFGINDNPPKFFSSVLGSIETTLIDLTSAYASIINLGKKTTPSLIEYVQDKTGKTIYRRDNNSCAECQISDSQSHVPPILKDSRQELVDPRSAYQMVSILEGTVKNGTARKATIIGKTLGGKTSTTNESRDGWFVGFSPELLVGIYVGFDQPKSLGKHEWGSTTALPIFVDFMSKALKNRPDLPFAIPPGIKLVRIDSRTGKIPNASTNKSDIIYEAFKVGTEADAESENSEETEKPETAGEESDSPVQTDDGNWSSEGTGGLY